MINKTKYRVFMLIFLFLGCENISNNMQSIASNIFVAYDWLEYKGDDDVYNVVKKNGNEFYNPVLGGFHPDHGMCRVGDSFYLITSSLSYFPDIPIFKSKDLVNWKKIGHVIMRNEQAEFIGAEGIDPENFFDDDGKVFYTKEAKGFVGACLALYASANHFKTSLNAIQNK